MPLAELIEGLGAERRPRITELGKIKIGGKGEARTSTGGRTWRLPRKDDHFTITTLNRNEAGDLAIDVPLMTELVVRYGDTDRKLRQIPIRLLSDDIDEVLQSAWVWYGGKTVGARSDGKTLTWFNDPRNGRRLDEPRTEPWTKEHEQMKLKDAPMFKLHSILNCVIAAKESRFGGVYKFRTTSLITLKQLFASLVEVQRLTGGVLMGMPLMLVVRPVQVAPDGKATTVHVVHAELRGAGLVELQEMAAKQMQFMLQSRKDVLAAQGQYRKLLAGPGEEETETDVEDIKDEFIPDGDIIEAEVIEAGKPSNGSRKDAIFGSESPAGASPADGPPSWDELAKHGITHVANDEVGGIVVMNTKGEAMKPDGTFDAAWSRATVQPNNAEQDAVARTMAWKAVSEKPKA